MAPNSQIVHQIGSTLISLVPEITRELLKGYSHVSHLEATADNQDVSTETDHTIGKFVGDKVKALAPDITIDSEEHEESSGEGDFILRIDPVDGSKHMVNHIDVCASLFSLSYNDETQFAMVVQPFAQKTYWAYKGEGAFLNAKKIQVNDEALSEGFVMCESPTSYLLNKNPDQFNKNMKLLSAVQKASFRTRNFGLISLAIAYVAEGSFCASIDLAGTTKLYDCEAALLIAREAGAQVGTITSNDLKKIDYQLTDDKKKLNEFLVVANPKAYKDVITIINSIS